MSFILSLSSRLSRKRPADVLLNFLTNSTSILVVFLNELSLAITASASSGVDLAETIRSYIEEDTESSLANVLDHKQQEKKLHDIAEDILRSFLDPKAYQCEPVRIFLRQVLAGLVLDSLLQSCSKADWINGWIVYLLEEGEPEIINAINAGVGDVAVQTELNESSGFRHGEKLGADKGEIFEQRIDSDNARNQATMEAKSLSQMIPAEQMNKTQSLDKFVSPASSAYALPTPTSSQSNSTYIARNKISNDNNTAAHEGKLPGKPSETPREGSRDTASSFTSFDQLGPLGPPLKETSESPRLTLYKAKISIFDDAAPGETAMIRAKPLAEYLIQIEPASSYHSGWMIARKYADFETLHEVLRRISIISGVPEFTLRYPNLPAWKTQTKAALRIGLEGYLAEALVHARLAESEGMKRFLERDQATTRLSSGRGVLGFPTPETFQSMGKGMLDVLASAPKGAAGGGKALLDGFSGVFQKKGSGVIRSRSPRRSMTYAEDKAFSEEKPSILNRSESSENTSQGPYNDPGPEDTSNSNTIRNNESTTKEIEKSIESLASRSSASIDMIEAHNMLDSSTGHAIPATSEQGLMGTRSHAEGRIASADLATAGLHMNLPPPPSEMTEDYRVIGATSRAWRSVADNIGADAESAKQFENRSEQNYVSKADSIDMVESGIGPTGLQNTPLTTEESQISVELIFAVISELYSLSSVWGIRRTLLNAAKTFLLRPGNPNLEAIRLLVQEQVIDANISDSGLASSIRKMRENTMPTEEELADWPTPLSPEEQEKLRAKARQLLVEQGMPPALKSIMGSAGTGEALGRVFDALQIQDVSRGLMFAIMLQGLRALTH